MNCRVLFIKKIKYLNTAIIIYTQSALWGIKLRQKYYKIFTIQMLCTDRNKIRERDIITHEKVSQESILESILICIKATPWQRRDFFLKFIVNTELQE